MSSAFSGSYGRGKRRAIVIGAHGQDGRLLCAELEKDHYDVTRVARAGVRTVDGVTLPFDMRDGSAVDELVAKISPDEIYYLAAHHHSSEEKTGDIATHFVESFTTHCLCLVYILNAIKRSHSTARLFNASSSLVFGYPDRAPQSESAPLRPVCAYGTTKAAGMNVCDIYRRDHGVFCSSGILFNHESPYRAPQFVTKRIVTGAVDVYLGFQKKLSVGSLSAQADWGSATDYVRAMRAILSLPEPDNFVVATGKLHSVSDFAAVAFEALGLDYQKYVCEQPDLVQRPMRKVPLLGDATKLAAATGWSPQIGFEQMIEEMVRAELATRGEHSERALPS
jgi:GDPmannose 4,6-dehydratase